MDSFELARDICRICLEHRGEINWNNKVKEFCGLSYKDCYYKYTRLDETDSDCFPTNLCNSCANELKNAHLLFEIALESINNLQTIFKIKENESELYCSEPNISQEINYESFDENCFTDEKTHIDIGEVICYSPVQEAVEETETGINNIMEKKLNKYLNNENFKPAKNSLKQQSTNGFSTDSLKFLETSLELNLQLEIHGVRLLKWSAKKPKLCKSLHQTPKKKRSKKNNPDCKSIPKQIVKHVTSLSKIQSSNRKMSTIKHSRKLSAKNGKQTYNSSDPVLLEPSLEYKSNTEQKPIELSKRDLIESNLQKSVLDSSIGETSPKQSEKSLLKELFGKDVDVKALCSRKPQKPRELICQYCSVKVNGSHHLRAHEATHLENRERKIICPKCGLKFYTKESLNEHKKIHEENREKKHKCEYCEKAFFHSGALNVHKRIHLGLMIKCQLCPKEFYRQIDLERHLTSHSATKLQNNDISVKKKKYKIQCQYCNKTILTGNWKAHKAAHLNQPQVKCKICNKNFFSRRSCSSHLKKTHRKEANKIEENIHYYVDCRRRMSHLMMKQQESLVTSIE